VVVKPFDDARMDRTHLGSRNHFFGSTSYFDLPKGTAGEAVAKALVQHLNKRGWQASLMGPASVIAVILVLVGLVIALLLQRLAGRDASASQLEGA